MKQIIFTVLFLSLIVTECSAQWENNYFPNPVAFGAYDTFFYASEPSNVYRLKPILGEADAGMSLGNGQSITAFGSIGSYVLAASNSVFGGGAYRSSNDGSNWLATNAPQSNCFLTLGGALFSGGSGGVYFSTDSGMNWSDLSNSPHGVNALATVGDTLFAGTSSGVFRSTDSGQSWQATSMTYGVSGIAIVGTVIMAFSPGRGVFRSIDNGSNWTNLNSGLFDYNITSLVTDGKNVFAGTGILFGNGSYGEGKGVFMSTDSGQHWDTINYGLPQGSYHGGDDYLSVNALGVFDTLLFVGVWDGAGTDNRTYVRSIPEILRQKGDTTASVVSEPVIASDSIAVYPNPASGVVTIRSAGTRILGVRVLNILGTEVLTIPRGYNSELHLDVSQLPSGTYFLEVETMDGMILRKITRE